jgi:hypothetical protein
MVLDGKEQGVERRGKKLTKPWTSDILSTQSFLYTKEGKY